MADNDASIFGNIYDYVQDGTITRIPDVDELRGKVSEGFKKIFGDDFTDAPETPNGVMIDELTLFVFDCLGVCVQNVNGMNLDRALGGQLDAIGGVFGVGRNADEGDADYRTRIRNAMGIGANGTVKGVRNALGKLTTLSSYCVLENNRGYAMSLPEGKANAIVVQPHSLFICVAFKNSPTTEGLREVAETIADSKAPGCGYTSNSNGSIQRITLDGPGTATEEVVFTVATAMPTVSVNVTMNPETYSGSDMTGDVESSVKRALLSAPICNVVTKNNIISAIAADGFGTATKVEFYVDGDEENSVIIMPYQHLSEDSIIVNVS